MTENLTPQPPQPAPGQGAPVVPPPPTYQVPPQQQQYYTQPQASGKVRSPGIGSAKKEKWPAAALAFVLGFIGIHKFYLGYKTEGLIMLLVALIGGACFGIGMMVMMVIAIIEAVKYVTLTTEEFDATYVKGYKGWL